jgi:hypothetical protein
VRGSSVAPSLFQRKEETQPSPLSAHHEFEKMGGNMRKGDMIAPSNEEKSGGAEKKKREREKNEVVKARLQGLVHWHSGRLPVEALHRNRSRRSGELLPKPSARKTIEPLVSC